MRKGLLLACGLLTLAGTAMSPNYSVKRSGTLMRGGYAVYLTPSIVNATRSDIRGFTTSIISTVCSNVNPQSYTRNPSVNLYLGAGTNFPSQNGRCEIIHQFYNGSPNAAAATEDYNSGQTNRSYYEFDIVIPTNNGFTYGDGYGNYIDRKTVLRHEFSHGIGLGHSRSSSALMNKAMSLNQVKQVDTDAQDGFRCIFDGTCASNECGPGAVEVVQRITEAKAASALRWSVGAGHQNIKGFNVYKKHGSSYESVNQALIKPTSGAGTAEYSFTLPQGQTAKSGTYYLEVILVNQQGPASFTVFKS